MWKIKYYETPTGSSPVFDFINTLAPKAQAKVANTFELLKEFGLAIGRSHTKKIARTPIWELRILGQDNLRIFYIVETGKTFLLLHGFAKKTQKTPKREIQTAIKRLEEYKSRS